MATFLTDICDDIQATLGIPSKLTRFLSVHPDLCVPIKEPDRSIAYGSVVPWHEWDAASTSSLPDHSPGSLIGWQSSGGEYKSFQAHLPSLAALGQRDKIPGWTCDIRDVTGLNASKATLSDFADMDAFVARQSPELIAEISDARLNANLAHDQIRILPGNSSDYFVRPLWDGRLFLMNSGGSHHFAAARYIASRIDRRVPLEGTLYTYAVNGSALQDLRERFDLYAVSNDAELSTGFHHAMASFGATYLRRPLPAPHELAQAIFLPKSQPRSLRASNVLRDAGAFDLGRHLADLCKRQMVGIDA